MASTHLSLHYHIVFGTKDHLPSIADAWRNDLHGFLGGNVRSSGGVPEIIGGVADHVHLLVGLRAAHCLADVLRELKSVSSGWVRQKLNVQSFAWQEGYGAFTVSASRRASVRAYIAKQAEHHRRHTFKEEYCKLLERSGVDFDSRWMK